MFTEQVYFCDCRHQGILPFYIDYATSCLRGSAISFKEDFNKVRTISITQPSLVELGLWLSLAIMTMDRTQVVQFGYFKTTKT